MNVLTGPPQPPSKHLNAFMLLVVKLSEIHWEDMTETSRLLYLETGVTSMLPDYAE